MKDICAQFAKGDFSSLAKSFTQAGFLVQQPCAGVIQIVSAKPDNKRLRLLLSVGVHGDETAPIEMLALLLDELRLSPESLAVDLLIVLGNPEAIAAAKRFIDVDLNRLFVPQRPLNHAREAQRADQLMQAASLFFEGHQHKYHLDLHTAIRASVYPTFAVVPGKYNPAFVSCLASAGIAAIVLSPQPSLTFSSYTCAHSGVVSCTAELGRVSKLGKNDLTQFQVTQRAISTLLRSGKMNPDRQNKTPPRIFRVVQELIKHSDAFQFTFDSSTPNFTSFMPHTVLAKDGEITYSVGEKTEYVLFPNPDVHIGLRAALMVADF